MTEDLNQLALAKEAAAYLRFVFARLSQRHDLVNLPKIQQQSSWMVPSGHGSYSSQAFERTVPSSAPLSIFYQMEILLKESVEQSRFQQTLRDAGVRPEETHYGVLLPLFAIWANHFIRGATPDEAANAAARESVNALLGNGVVSRSRHILNRMTLDVPELRLGDAVTLRPVTEEELWEMGNLSPFDRFPPDLFTSSKILDIQNRHNARENHDIDRRVLELGQNAVALLCLLGRGIFETRHWGKERNFGMNSLGRTSTLGRDWHRFGHAPGDYRLTLEMAAQAAAAWPRFRQVLNREDHFLRLPARRLVDGLQRARSDDALLDYSIGLESLLTAGSRAELSYRFSLRGATVLCWSSGDRAGQLKALQSFYEVRSSVIHGDNRHQPDEVRQARENGESALRTIWWWFFNLNEDDIRKATDQIDARILNMS